MAIGLLNSKALFVEMITKINWNGMHYMNMKNNNYLTKMYSDTKAH